MNIERLKTALLKRSHDTKRTTPARTNNDTQLQLATSTVTPNNSRTDHSADMLSDWTVKYKEAILNAVIDHRNSGGFTCNQSTTTTKLKGKHHEQ